MNLPPKTRDSQAENCSQETPGTWDKSCLARWQSHTPAGLPAVQTEWAKVVAVDSWLNMFGHIAAFTEASRKIKGNQDFKKVLIKVLILLMTPADPKHRQNLSAAPQNQALESVAHSSFALDRM